MMYQFQREITWMGHACPYQLNNVDGPRTSAPIQQRAPSLSWRSPCPIGVTRFELAASTSLTWRATSCATPRNSQNMPCSVTKSLFFSTDTSVIIRVCIRKSKGLFPLDFRRYKADLRRILLHESKRIPADPPAAQCRPETMERMQFNKWRMYPCGRFLN